jgi:hypothetical protein
MPDLEIHMIYSTLNSTKAKQPGVICSSVIEIKKTYFRRFPLYPAYKISLSSDMTLSYDL